MPTSDAVADRMMEDGKKLVDDHRRLHSILIDVMCDHMLITVLCDEETKTDRPVCACAHWRCEPQPNIREAVKAHAEHVIAEAKRRMEGPDHAGDGNGMVGGGRA